MAKSISGFRFRARAGVMGIGAVLLGLMAQGAQAQSGQASAWPLKPIRLIVAAAPGGGTDVVGRMVAQRLGDRLGQPFIVENRGGAGGSVAADLVAHAAPDGYTLLMTNDQFTVQASFAGKVNYDVLRDFTPVGTVGRTAIVVGVNPSLGVTTLPELVALVRASPGRYAFSSCGNGTPLHLAGELLNLSAGIDLAHVAYRGCAPPLVDAVSGQVPIFFNMLGNAIPYERSGKLRLLAVAASQRLAGTPGLPTVAEAGYGDFEAFPWYGVLAPAGLPREPLARLSGELGQAVASQEFAERLRGIFFEPVALSPEAFAETMRRDLSRWGRVVREARVKAD
jgi:tripartite-type tricarboxylate transporter receptor subunit TctC